MEYTILIYEKLDNGTSPSTPEAEASVLAAFSAYTKTLIDAGVMVGGAGLQPAETATTIRLRDGKRHVQDGPYADTKEQLGGLYIIDVPTLDEALDWASRIPALPGSILEVRPNLMATPAP